ncbi:hypothetical protein OPQ81_007552 [Rhizoctonia solani]|nr:hypothetical protein OPQ81_007552 [Rhizoctonia solani]
MRGCGRHECNRVCCPLAGTASKFKGKRRMDLSSGTDVAEDDPEGWHTCDLICNKKLSCGNHNCDCGSCSQICGKPRKKCGHPCPVPCHAPAACPSIDAVPCPAVITVTCGCGRITQPAPCGASRVLKCQDACLIAKRNLRLAEALGISESGRSSGYTQIAWNPDLIAFARAPVNQPFVKNMEKALADFVAGDKKAHVLPHMPEVRRKIITEVAEVYRITTQLVDEEPRRSVQLIRRIDSRIPTPLLSQVSAPAPSRLGSLGDLRKPATVVKPASPSASSASTTPAWRSGTSSSHVNPNAASNLASSLGPPTSGSLPQVPSAVPWARPNGSSVAESPISSTPSRTTPALPERVRVAETREDVPANWEDD